MTTANKQPPKLSRRAFQEQVRHVIVLYASGVRDGTYEALLDDLSIVCSDWQWRAIELYLEQVDLWMAETDKGTLYQKEKAAAKREGRKSRYPNVFLQGTPEAERTIAQLRQEYGMGDEPGA